MGFNSSKPEFGGVTINNPSISEKHIDQKSYNKSTFLENCVKRDNSPKHKYYYDNYDYPYSSPYSYQYPNSNPYDNPFSKPIPIPISYSRYNNGSYYGYNNGSHYRYNNNNSWSRQIHNNKKNVEMDTKGVHTISKLYFKKRWFIDGCPFTLHNEQNIDIIASKTYNHEFYLDKIYEYISVIYYFQIGYVGNNPIPWIILCQLNNGYYMLYIASIYNDEEGDFDIIISDKFKTLLNSNKIVETRFYQYQKGF